ncbi:hypothetical protein SDC9_124545 [bioreactor metagenome]|uniref:Uncharacterized protein n=1 Tax=bioreactor metagenome TaxID=1076179 RepID=A0A645CKT3_9ZZZZ
MTTRTEQQLALVAKRLVIHVGRNSVCALFLLRERHIIRYAVFIGIHLRLLVHQRFEEQPVLRRNGEVHIGTATLAGSVKRPFHQMLFERRTCPVFIRMKLEQPLGQRTVVQPLGREQRSHNRLVIALLHQLSSRFTRLLFASRT